MPNHPHDRLANYTGHRQNLNVQIDRFVLSYGYAGDKFILFMACGQGYDS